MHRHVGAQFAGQVGSAGEQRVGRKVMADQRDPTLHQSTRWELLHDGALTVEHFLRGSGEGALLDVPAPHTDGRPQPRLGERLGNPVGVGNRACFDHGGDAAGERLNCRQRTGNLIVDRAVGSVQRNRPLEDRRTRWEEIGNATAHQRVAGEVLVRVDHARRDNAVRGVEQFGLRILLAQLRSGTDSDDELTVDDDRSSDEHLAASVHGDDVATGDDAHHVLCDQPRRAVREKISRTIGSKCSRVSLT